MRQLPNPSLPVGKRWALAKNVRHDKPDCETTRQDGSRRRRIRRAASSKAKALSKCVREMNYVVLAVRRRSLPVLLLLPKASSEGIASRTS